MFPLFTPKSALYTGLMVRFGQQQLSICEIERSPRKRRHHFSFYPFAVPDGWDCECEVLAGGDV